jgi:4-amino-4-deoxy-L-arabinose transferase-like glycosyltransferase
VKTLFTGRPEDPRWARPALWLILLLATGLYAWNISSITGNSFYNAAVYSGTKSWKAFFFGALDSGSFITVDKPPFALWVMGISARVFGFGNWQLMLPMVAAGVGSVAVLYPWCASPSATRPPPSPPWSSPSPRSPSPSTATPTPTRSSSC